MTYTAEKPKIAEASEQLKARIPGWGADLDPSDRPSVPRERFDPGATGAHWDFPERQPEKWPRERSIEHAILPPVFGTSCPPAGLSGVLRKFAYARYSEGRAAHWLLLLGADRVDAIEKHLKSFLTLHPDNPVTQTGVLSERRRHGLSSRVRQKRTDVVHQALDPVIVAGPWIVAGAVALRAGKWWTRRPAGAHRSTALGRRSARQARPLILRERLVRRGRAVLAELDGLLRKLAAPPRIRRARRVCPSIDLQCIKSV
jgi:hypothetical protein